MLEYASYKTNKNIINNLIKYYIYYQKYKKSPSQFKFILKKDANINYLILVDIIYIDGSPILHIVNKTTRFQEAR